MVEPLTLIVILLALIFSFFFSGIEIAFLSANRLHIELRSNQGSLSGRIMSYFAKKQSYFIGTTLIGNTLALVVFGVYSAQVLNPFLRQYLWEALRDDEAMILIAQTLISTLVIIITAEFLPKSLFLINPNRMLSALAIPFQLLFYLLSPLTLLMVYLSRIFMIYVLRLPHNEEKPVFELTDLNTLIKNTRQIKHENEEVAINKKIFHNALEFRHVILRDCMIPRMEMICVDIKDGMENLKKAFVESRHSKIVVYDEDPDSVIGYCHSSALFNRPDRIEDILTPPILAPETMLAKTMLLRFIREQKSLAVTVDEFGGVSGMVTMEDLMEKIFGEIEDEHDQTELFSKKIDDYNYLFSARHKVDFLNEIFNLQLPTGEYDTLGGLILSYTEDFPTLGSKIYVKPYFFTIQKMTKKRIEIVKLTIENKASSEAG